MQKLPMAGSAGRKIGAVLCAAALGAAMLSGCGGGSSANSNTSGTSSEQKSGDAKTSRRAGLPDGFPEDVPLPEFSGATKYGGSSGPSKSWSILFGLKTPTETPMDDYAALLADAGYTVEKGSGNSKEAEGPKWGVYFHTTLENTMSITVMEQ